jgi:ABC-type sugar transport system substrate-binding protein
VASLVVATIAVALTACGTAEDSGMTSGAPSAASTADAGAAGEAAGAVAMGFAGADITIWNDQLEIMRPIVEAAGYEFLTSDPQWEIQRQVSDWETWINRGDVKAIMGYPIQTDSMVPVTQKAAQAGIPVLGYLLTWEGIAAATVVDSYQGGYDLAAATAESVAAIHGDNPDLNVAILGNRETDFSAQAVDGLTAGFTSVLPDATIIELKAITREDGYNATQSQLIADPETYVWLGGSNDPILGAYQAVLDSGIATDDPRFFLTSRDATDETLDYIKIPDSIYRTSLVVPSRDLATANAQLLLDAAAGKKVSNIEVPGVLVDAANADQYYTTG